MVNVHNPKGRLHRANWFNNNDRSYKSKVCTLCIVKHAHCALHAVLLFQKEAFLGKEETDGKGASYILSQNILYIII